MTGINLVDLFAVLLVVVAVIFGWRSGFIVQAFALAGLVGGLAVMVLLAPTLAGLVAELDPLLRTVVVIGAVAGIVLLGQALGSTAGGVIRQRLGRGILGGLDQGAGAVFGMARGIFVVWLMGGLLGLFPVPALATEARQSIILRAIDTRLPSPLVLAAELGRIMEAAGLPDVLVGAPPPIAPPVDGPDIAEAEQIAAAARRSTVRVEAIACGRFMSGTGFAVENNHLVTNAHVVAGADRVWVSFDGSLDRHAGQVVRFDPQLDIALIEVDGLDVEPLELATDLPSRGEPAAALGFTGGGRQRLIPAVVSRTINAIGRDIYGNAVVARDVIELRADVAPGDSGGPVLLAGGTVGGVTFSESRTEPSIGYALSPMAVADSIAAALDSTTAVSTAVCLN